MVVIEIDVAQGALENALAAVQRGDEVVLTRDGHPVARMLPALPHAMWRTAEPGNEGTFPDRVPGTARGLVAIRDDFDDPMQDFRDYV